MAGNARIINLYAQIAREKGFKGIFAVVSDPVDLLCNQLLWRVIRIRREGKIIWA
jgi:malate/lactate dehydrogenase